MKKLRGGFIGGILGIVYWVIRIIIYIVLFVCFLLFMMMILFIIAALIGGYVVIKTGLELTNIVTGGFNEIFPPAIKVLGSVIKFFTGKKPKGMKFKIPRVSEQPEEIILDVMGVPKEDEDDEDDEEEDEDDDNAVWDYYTEK